MADVWEASPADSHTYGFRAAFRDLSPAWPFDPSIAAVITVAFKPAAINGVHPDTLGTAYDYYFADEQLGRIYLGKLRAAKNPAYHPGHVVWEMRRAGIPYSQVI